MLLLFGISIELALRCRVSLGRIPPPLLIRNRITIIPISLLLIKDTLKHSRCQEEKTDIFKIIHKKVD